MRKTETSQSIQADTLAKELLVDGLMKNNDEALMCLAVIAGLSPTFFIDCRRYTRYAVYSTSMILVLLAGFLILQKYI